MAEVPATKIVSPFSSAAPARAEELPVFTSDPIVAHGTLRDPQLSISLPSHFPGALPCRRFPTAALFTSSRATIPPRSFFPLPPPGSTLFRSLCLPLLRSRSSSYISVPRSDRADTRKSRLMHFDQDPFPRAASNGRDSGPPFHPRSGNVSSRTSSLWWLPSHHRRLSFFIFYRATWGWPCFRERNIRERYRVPLLNYYSGRKRGGR